MFVIGLTILLLLFAVYIYGFITYERKVGEKLTRKNVVGQSKKRVWPDNEGAADLCMPDVQYDNPEIKLEYVSIKK